MDKQPRFVIFANGLVPDPDKVRALLRSGDHIVCADGGTRLALALGLHPEILIGDLDSIVGADRRRVEQINVPIRTFSPDKDETDLELALDHALQGNPAAILIIGAVGGRLDHTLGNIALLSDSRLSGIDCRIDDGVEEVILCRTSAEVLGKAGDLVSLIPWGRLAMGVRTDGLRWKLVGDTLYPDRSRGISNELLAERAIIHMEPGMLIVVHSRRS